MSDGIVYNGSIATHFLSMRTVLMGLRLEQRTNGAMRLTSKAPKCSVIVKEKMGAAGFVYKGKKVTARSRIPYDMLISWWERQMREYIDHHGSDLSENITEF